MGKGLISNIVEEDVYLIEQYDNHIIAIEFNDPLSEVETWRENKMEWAKTILQVRTNLESGKK